MKILIAYDGSLSADAALEDLRIAGLPPQAEALVVCVADRKLHPLHHDSNEAEPTGSWISGLAEAEALAETASERIGSWFPEWTVSSEALWGPPAKVLLGASASWLPDLLVAGSHGRSRVARVFLGSVSLELVHKARCSVRLVRAGFSVSGDSPIRIIIGNDGSPEAETVIRSVVSRSWPDKAEAHVISVVKTLVPVPDDLAASTFAHESAFNVIREADERERLRLRDSNEHHVRTLCGAGLVGIPSVTEGDPGEVIVAEANRLNGAAIFVGSRRRGRFDRLLLGSVCTHVVTHARCPAEIVRQN